MKRAFFAFVIFAVVAIGFVQFRLKAEDRKGVEPTALNSSNPHTELERLKQENELLKKENQQLRRLLAGTTAKAESKDSVATTSPALTKVSASASSIEQPIEWSISSTGKRHNSNCRYFDAAKSCNREEGQACKVCGG